MLSYIRLGVRKRLLTLGRMMWLLTILPHTWELVVYIWLGREWILRRAAVAVHAVRGPESTLDLASMFCNFDLEQLKKSLYRSWGAVTDGLEIRFASGEVHFAESFLV